VRVLHSVSAAVAVALVAATVALLTLAAHSALHAVAAASCARVTLDAHSLLQTVAAASRAVTNLLSHSSASFFSRTSKFSAASILTCNLASSSDVSLSSSTRLFPASMPAEIFVAANSFSTFKRAASSAIRLSRSSARSLRNVLDSSESLFTSARMVFARATSPPPTAVTTMSLWKVSSSARALRMRTSSVRSPSTWTSFPLPSARAARRSSSNLVTTCSTERCLLVRCSCFIFASVSSRALATSDLRRSLRDASESRRIVRSSVSRACKSEARRRLLSSSSRVMRCSSPSC